MLSSHHNIRRPAFWLVLTCMASIAFFIVTDPRVGLARYNTNNPVDAVHRTELGTVIGLSGAGLLLLIGLFLCTRKGSPPTMELPKVKK